MGALGRPEESSLERLTWLVGERRPDARSRAQRATSVESSRVAMPIDKNAEEEDLREERRNHAYTDYDCPSCNANNPVEMALRDGDETRCNYCGTDYKVRLSEEGRLKLKEL
jgi:hypothetical protein